MMSDIFDFILIVIIAVGLLLLGVVIGSNVTIKAWQWNAIQHGYGEYCSTTGEWAWIGECKEQ